MPEKQMRPIVWVGDSKRRLKEFPRDVQRDVGFALEIAQGSETHSSAKPLRGFSGVYEIVSNYTRDTYRAVYVVNLGNTIYVLHCFQKKSKRRIKTPKKEIDLIRSRLNWAKNLAHEGNKNE